MGWIVRLEVAPAEVDVVSTVLWDRHTTGIAEVTPTDATGLTTELVAGFDDREQAWAAMAHLGRPARVEPVDASQWVDHDRRGTLTVAGATVAFEVGAAFGHGAHPTTVLTAELLAGVIGDHQKNLSRSVDRGSADGRLSGGFSVLDFGTGTGVLALAALELGAALVVAVDNDRDAIDVARTNLASAVAADRATVTDALPQADPHGPFDVIAANVLLPVHRSHGPALAARLAPGATLVVGGTLVDQEAEVLAVYPQLVVTARKTDDDWLALALTHPPTGDRRD